jgi:hypothetical protein
MTSFFRFGLVAVALGFTLAPESRADVRADLELLRNRCLWYAAGRAPNDTNTITLRHGLYAQSPFSPAGQIDLAASGFSLAALPSAVEGGLISSNAAKAIATSAATRVLEMVTKSAAASNTTEYGRYGYGGMLYHYAVWNSGAAEFRADPDAEVSSIDTTLLLFGLLVCGNHFGEPVMTNFVQATGKVAWSNWLDRVNPGNLNQFYMAYSTNGGLTGRWDWRTDETALICLMAAMNDPNLDARTIWRAWYRGEVTYTSPAPDSATFRCRPSWNGDPFTDFNGLHFVDTARMPPDVDGIDWFDNNRTSYRGHVEYFRKERGYLGNMTFAFLAGASNPIAEPKGDPATPPTRTDCPLYSLAGGLPFYSAIPASNEIARTISSLITNTPASGLFDWHGWPVAAVNAVSASHAPVSYNIVGQDISSIALSIDNYLTNRIQNIVFRDSRLKRVLNTIWPPRAMDLALHDNKLDVRWKTVPASSFTSLFTSDLTTGWNASSLESISDGAGSLTTAHSTESERQFYHLGGF